MPLENHFVVIVPVYNAEKYIEKCLESILNQTYKNFKLVVIDDLSSDSTNQIITNIYDKYNYSFIVCRLENHYGSPIFSFKTACNIFSNNRNDILVTVDGDDYLYDNKVLEYLNEVYQDPNIWMTYGSFLPLSESYGKFGKQITNTKTYRSSGQWYTSHLRTIKNKVFKAINDKDLRDVDGEYYKFAGDAACMFSALEICGLKHIKFIDKVLYYYNDLNPLNEMKVDKDNQLRIGTRLRSLPIYDEIEYL